MKKIAIFILLIFTLVQAAPALQTVFNLENGLVFSLDEENNGDCGEIKEKKEKKDYSAILPVIKLTEDLFLSSFQLTETIHPSPCLENLTPPPNFC